MNQDRRKFFKTGAALAAVGLSASALEAKSTQRLLPEKKGPRVVVVGGGYGGLTAAKTLRNLAPHIEVVVLEKRGSFFSCPYSNAWVGGIASYEELHRDYFQPARRHGYHFVQTTVTGIDRSARKVETTEGSISYDYLVLSPGIAYDYTPYFGADTQKARAVYESCPPALIPGSEHLALVRELRAVRSGNYAIVIPPGTFRCPPAPYERACMVAAWYRQNKIKGKVIIIDPRERPMAKADGFLHSFQEIYGDIIEYHHSTQFKDIDLDKQILHTERFDASKADFVAAQIPYAAANVIAPVRASALIAQAGLETHNGGWAKLAGPHQQAANDDRVFVIGDAQGEYPYPKSGQMANAQAKVAAKHIVARVAGGKLAVGAHLPFNVCYSLIETKPVTGIVVFHDVSYGAEKGVEVSARDTKVPDTKTGQATTDWFGGIMDDMFL